ncbi:hypothetical protein [Jiella sp. M17.18]|uniref:hypothetical protein n=1 Tax=Jiella sp. M17.18 TaxID=3234247 RepID=UPI0034DFACA3
MRAGTLALAAFATLAGGTAAAKDAPPFIWNRTTDAHASVQVEMTSNVDPERSTPSDRDALLRSAYELAGRQCRLLLETIADDCSLRSVNTSLSDPSGMIYAGRQRVTIRINLSILPKDGGAPAAPAAR